MSSLHLYRSLLRESKRIADYNFRSYAKRRARLGFEQGRKAASEDIPKLMEEGQKALQLIQRQAILSQMYAPTEGSVMETVAASNK